MEFISARTILVGVILILSLFYWVFNFIILYHLTRFGTGTQPKKIAVIFLLGSIFLYSLSIILFISIDLEPILMKLQEIDLQKLIEFKYQP